MSPPPTPSAGWARRLQTIAEHRAEIESQQLRRAEELRLLAEEVRHAEEEERRTLEAEKRKMDTAARQAAAADHEAATQVAKRIEAEKKEKYKIDLPSDNLKRRNWGLLMSSSNASSSSKKLPSLPFGFVKDAQGKISLAPKYIAAFAVWAKYSSRAPTGSAFSEPCRNCSSNKPRPCLKAVETTRSSGGCFTCVGRKIKCDLLMGGEELEVELPEIQKLPSAQGEKRKAGGEPESSLNPKRLKKLEDKVGGLVSERQFKDFRARLKTVERKIEDLEAHRIARMRDQNRLFDLIEVLHAEIEGRPKPKAAHRLNLTKRVDWQNNQTIDSDFEYGSMEIDDSKDVIEVDELDGEEDLEAAAFWGSRPFR